MHTRAISMVVALSLVAGPVVAQPVSAHETAATAAYEAGDLATAQKEFEAAYAETRRPELLYVIGRVNAERADCAGAIQYFNRYLATDPGPKATEAAQAEIVKCKKTTGTGTEPGSGSGTGSGSDTGSDTGSGSAGTTATGMGTGTGKGRSKLGLGLLAGGAVAEAGAIVFYMRARGAQCGEPVCSNMTYDEYLEAEDQARSLRLTSIILAGAGGALLAGGLYLYLTRDRGRERTITLVPTSGGAAFVLDGQF